MLDSQLIGDRNGSVTVVPTVDGVTDPLRPLTVTRDGNLCDALFSGD
jgi:hypothetical protein